MPQNTPMKRQFTTIDGRTVMSNLPQHWGGNDWKITGVDNPLPVGNYVQTEAGVWIPQKGSDDGAADVRLTGSYTEYKFFDALAITDTNRVVSQVYDISNLSKFYLYVRSTLDAEVRLGIRVTANKNEPSTNAIMFWNGQQYENTFPTNNTGLPIPNTQNAWVLLNSRYKWLNDIIANRMAIQLMATQAPATGSISVYLVGRKY